MFGFKKGSKHTNVHLLFRFTKKIYVKPNNKQI